MRAWRSLTALFVVLVASFLLISACSDDDDNGNGNGGNGGGIDVPTVPGQGGGNGDSTMLTLVAENNEFDKDTLTAPANAEVTVELENKDAGVMHNFSLYQSSDATESIFVGDLFTGEDTMTYTFTSPPPGTYFFRCDVHPDTMNGDFITE